MSGKVLIAAPSPAPDILPGELVLHRHTWYGHIRPNHSNVLLGHVRQAMTNPSEIVESKTVAGDHVLLNHEASTGGETATLRVAIRHEVETGTNLVTSAYYSNATNHGNIVWTRGDD